MVAAASIMSPVQNSHNSICCIVVQPKECAENKVVLSQERVSEFDGKLIGREASVKQSPTLAMCKSLQVL